MMYYLNNDYSAGAHPDVMLELASTNGFHTVGYGYDEFTADAKLRILKECGLPEGDVFFFEGGTQTNLVCIDALLGRNDGVVCADTAHIAVHEAGAIEACGHKVITIPGSHGKLSLSLLADLVESYEKDDTRLHMVRPAMVYLSFPTELGTLYTSDELKEIYSFCKQHGMYLYIDGARLAYGLAASELTFKHIASMCDVFYIGGTKCGALFGEALVCRNKRILPRFFSIMKLHGAVLAKGRLLGIQFKSLFTDNLYLNIGRYAVGLANKLSDGLESMGYESLFGSTTNQRFFRMPNSLIDKLHEKFMFDYWGARGNDGSIVRFVTDWSTTPDTIRELLSAVMNYSTMDYSTSARTFN